jgi:hypothetical protein
MSDWTIWRHKAYLVLEVDGRMIEVVDPVTQTQPHRSPELNFTKILDAVHEAQMRRPPKYREVTLDV